MQSIQEKDFNLIRMKAISRIYLKEIIKKTPGSGTVAGGWDIKIKGDDVIIYNEEFGDIVEFLEGGTKKSIIRAKPGKYLRFEKPKVKRASPYSKIPGNKAFEKDGYIFAKAVRNPGIKARLFIQKILDDKQLDKAFDIEFTLLLKEKLQI